MCCGCESKHFTLHHDNALHFVTSQWQSSKSRTHVAYLVYRIFFAVFMVVNYGLYLEYGLSYDKVNQNILV